MKPMRFSFILPLALCAVLLGCGDGKRADAPIRTAADLNGRPVAHMSSGFHREKLKKLAPDLVFHPYTDYGLVFEALCGRKIDAISLGASYAELWSAKFPGRFRVAFAYADDACGFLARRGWPHLPALNGQLRRMRESGEAQRIFRKWMDAVKRGETPDMPASSAPADAPVVRVAAFSGTEPHCFVAEGMHVVGSCAEILQTCLDRIGLATQFQIQSFEGMCAAVESGRSDVACAWIYTGGNTFTTVDVSEMFAGETMCVLVRDERGAGGDGRWASLVRSFRQTFVVERRWKLLLDGFGVTALITVCMALLGVVLAFPVCLLRASRLRAFAFIGTVYVRVFQGTPILVLLLLFYYVLFADVEIGAVPVAILAFGMNLGANLGEALRSAVSAVPRGQTEAALALGYGPVRAFWRIVLPQAVRIILPVFRGELVAHFKATSVVGFIAVTDLTKASDLIRNRTYEALFPILATAAIYFVVAGVLSWSLDRLHRRLANRSVLSRASRVTERFRSSGA